MDLLSLARPAVLASRAMPVRVASQLMMNKKVGAIIVIDTNEHPIGIFTDKDMVDRVVAAGRYPDITTLGEVMTSPVQTAPGRMTAAEALQIMMQKHFRHLPVVDMNNRVLGIASLRYLLMRRIGEKQADVETLAAYVTAGGPG